jgi:hypothetical protein
MKRWTQFMERWRAYRRVLGFALTFARSARVTCELVLELQLDGVDDDGAFEMLRAGCPGWRVDFCGDDRVRLVPPAVGVRG